MARSRCPVAAAARSRAAHTSRAVTLSSAVLLSLLGNAKYFHKGDPRPLRTAAGDNRGLGRPVVRGGARHAL
ncbi:hypothetical protein RR46_02375 [Papilio xuthus]|uniref:Uncharacterized protein n=1 Tax=Papilio xuthus TaxID=66420 RepID=A0A194Q1F8_PAPXU|nr:hypothetical protein RR46_02375 [Papilio xuthus]